MARESKHSETLSGMGFELFNPEATEHFYLSTLTILLGYLRILRHSVTKMQGITDESPLFLEFETEYEGEKGIATAILDERGELWISYATHDPRDMKGSGFADVYEVMERLPAYLHPGGPTHH